MTEHTHGNLAVRTIITGLIFGAGIGLIIFEIFTTLAIDIQSLINIIIGVTLFFLGIILRMYVKGQIKLCPACGVSP